ncbi:MAG: hypothetical protein M3Q36_00040 [bacterium]|nr:hypothetical protein [bacterium]
MAPTMERSTLESEQFDYETRRYYDVITWLAEVMPGSMRTPFEYSFDGRELYANDGGALRPIFDDAIEQAKLLPGYEQRRRPIEKGEYLDMIAMMRSELPNTMVVESDFPFELMDAIEDEGGYDVARKQTMLRVICKTPEGKLRMFSQSLDGSDREALEAIRNYLGFETEPGELLGQRMHLEMGPHEQEFLIDQLTGLYDRSLEARYGGAWEAGRPGKQIDTYRFVCGQKDLINAYLATTDMFLGGDAEYDLAAAVQARLYESKTINIHSNIKLNEYFMPAVAAHALALQEMGNAGNIARQSGETFSGCGATISNKTDKQGQAESQIEQLGFGNKADKLPDDKYGTRYFICPNSNCKYENTRPKDTLIPKCKKCGTDVSCSDTSSVKKTFWEIIEKSFSTQEKYNDSKEEND